jgi:hypothetical protein
VTQDQARRTANVVMAAAALGAAVVVLRSPSLRRLVWGLLKRSRGPLAAYGAVLVRDAWEQSGSLEYDRDRAPSGAPRLR